MTLILSGTNGLSDVDGDASTPAVRGTDANSGIFFGADTVGVSTNGVERAKVGNSETVFNDGGADVDFRVEGDTEANLLFVDAGNDRVGVKTSSPAVAFDVVGQVRASTGILFGSDTAAANALDDYEEGTFTPTYEGISTAGTTTYTIQNGYYTKIGNIVTVFINLGWSNATGTGSSVVKGLPFQSANSANNYAAVSIRNDGLAQSGGQISAYVNINSTDMRIGYSNLTTGADADIGVDASASRIMFQATYRAA